VFSVFSVFSVLLALLSLLVGVPGLGSPGTRRRCPLRCGEPVPGAARWVPGRVRGRVSGILVHDREELSCCGELPGNITDNSP
jgi:hypothetical protein